MVRQGHAQFGDCRISARLLSDTTQFSPVWAGEELITKTSKPDRESLMMIEAAIITNDGVNPGPTGVDRQPKTLVFEDPSQCIGYWKFHE
jgi:hypothetical protein